MNKYAKQSRVKESRSCVRKRAYRNEVEAELAMKRAGCSEFYKCRYCSAWHIANTHPRGNQK